jgi:hypothetical protein
VDIPKPERMIEVERLIGNFRRRAGPDDDD